MNTTTITKALQAARECIHADRTSFADCSIGPGNTMEPDDAEALAEYDAVLALVDEALAALQPQPAADWRDRLTVNLMRQGAGLTKTQIRALIAYAHDGIEPDPALFEQPAAAVSDADIWRLWDSQDRPELTGGPCPVKFARAILALRPQAVPMTEDAERLDWMATNEAHIGWNREGEVCRVWVVQDEEKGAEPLTAWHSSARAAIDEARGITAQGAQGEQG